MKTKSSKQTAVKTARLLEFTQHSIDRLGKEIDARKDVDDPIQKLEAAYYDLLRRNARDVVYELGLLGARAPRTVPRAAVRKAVATVITENNVKRLSTMTTHIGRMAYERAEECLRDGFQPFMS